MKTLYIDIDGESLICPSEEIEVFPCNLIHDFFFFIGEKIAREYAEQDINLIRLVTGYEKESGTTPFTEQWNELKALLFGENPQGAYTIALPMEYLSWLRLHTDNVYHSIYDKYYKGKQSVEFIVDIKELYDDIIEPLVDKVCRYLGRNADKGFTHLGFNYPERCSPVFKVMGGKTSLKICRVRVICPVKMERGYGIVDIYGNVVTPFGEFDYISGFIGNLSVAGKDGYYGLINAQAEVVVPFEYDSIALTCNDILFARKNGKVGAIIREGEVVVPFEYDEEVFGYKFYDGLVRMKKNGKVGYINREGEVVIPFEYDDGADFSEGLVFVLKEGKWKVLNVKGENAFQKEFFYPDYKYSKYNKPRFYGGRAFVSTSDYGKYALINKKGELLSEPKIWMDRMDEAWNWDYPFDGELAVISRNGKYGFVDRNGTVVIPLDLDDVDDPRTPWRSGLAKVKRNGRYGVINTEGRVVLPFCEEGYHLSSKSGRLIMVKLGHLNCPPYGAYGFVDPAKENFLIPPIYGSLEEFSEIVNLAVARADTKYGYIDTRGKAIVPFIYDYAGSATVSIEYDTIY